MTFYTPQLSVDQWLFVLVLCVLACQLFTMVLLAMLLELAVKDVGR